MEKIKLDDAQGFVVYGPSGEEIKGVFTNGRVDDKEVPEGVFKYELREGDSGDICTLEKSVAVNHAGTVLTEEEIDFGKNDRLEFPTYEYGRDEDGGLNGEEKLVSEGNGWDYTFDDEVLDEISFLEEGMER